MKKLSLALAAASLLAVGTQAQAQSAFAGFYGQLATGYESNSVSNLNTTTKDPGQPSENWSSGSQDFGGAPIVAGLGYNFSVAPNWLVGIGADYSFLPQTSSTYSGTNPNGGSNGKSGTISGMSVKASNRFNIFITPGYEIDKDKLVYLKAGYSSVSATGNPPTRYTDNGNSTNSGNIPGLGSQSSTLSGYVVGLGYKQIITGGIYGFAEGNYMSYNKPSYSSTLSAANGGGTVTSNPSVSSYQLLVGVGYKF